MNTELIKEQLAHALDLLYEVEGIALCDPKMLKMIVESRRTIITVLDSMESSS